jgi:hypothetical protein
MAITIDNSSLSLDRTVKIFDSFYSNKLVVPFSDFDMVNGYFLNVCTSNAAAKNFTYLFFLIAQQTNTPVFNLLAQISTGTNANGASGLLQMNSIICYYLNAFKAKTSLYGISVIPQPNQNAARNVVQ